MGSLRSLPRRCAGSRARRAAAATRRRRSTSRPPERTPFQALAGCLVSQRVRDEQTIRICAELFGVAPTPEALLRLSEARLQRILRPAGFWRQKAKHLRGIAHAVVEQGGVPQHARGAGRAAGHRSQVREHRAGECLRRAGHRDRYARAPHLEPPGLGADEHAGENRGRSDSPGADALAAPRERAPRRARSADLQAAGPPLRRLPRGGSMRAAWSLFITGEATDLIEDPAALPLA